MANEFLGREPFGPRLFNNWLAITYWLYPLTIAPFLGVFGGANALSYTSIVVFQTFIASLGVVFLFKTMVLLSRRRKMALGLTVFFLMVFDVFSWERYILTDSINCNLLIISAYYVVKYLLAQGSSKRDVVILAVMLFILIFLRPTNIVFITTALIAIAFKNRDYIIGKIFPRKIRSIFIGLLVLIGASVLLVQRSEKPLSYSYGFVNKIKSGVVIIGRHKYDVPKSVDWPRLTPYQKAAQVLKVVGKRLIYFWAVDVDGFSRSHSILNYAILLPLWILSLLSLFISRVKDVVFYWIVAVVLSYNIFHAILMLDFDFRYRIVVIPFLFLLIAKVMPSLHGALFFSQRERVV